MSLPRPTTELRVLIADDEPPARRGIRQLLEHEPHVIVVGEARDGRETLQAIRLLRPNVLFLDVQMPDMDGLAVVRAQGADRMPHTVFVTAYDSFAIRAFDARAVDYLVKPVNEVRFAESVGRLRHRVAADQAVQRSRAPARAAPLVVNTRAGDLVLDQTEIEWIEADDYYSAIHAGGRRHLLREALASLEIRLDAAQFIRAHRSAIVNVSFVRELRGASGGQTALLLRDGTRIPVSRRRREAVIQRIRALGM
jgi:two-component system LytT family response regulator